MNILNRFSKAGLTGLLAVSLSACGMFSESNPKFDPAPLTEYSPSASVTTRWSANIGSGGNYGFAPQVVRDTVYAATPSGSVVALSLNNGTTRWRAGDAALSAGVGSDGNTTAVVTNQGVVVAYDANGKKRWETKAASAVNVPPTVGQGLVVVRTSDYRVQAFDANDGELRWEVQRPGPALALRTNSRMIMVPDLLIAGMPNGRLLVIDTASGVVRWEGSIAAARGASDLERISDVVGEPLIMGPLLCGVNYQGGTTCFDISQGGRKIWNQNVSSATGMTHDERQIYVSGQSDVLYALDIGSGQVEWQQRALLNRRLTAPAVLGSTIVVGDYQGYVHFLSRADGSLMARLQINSDPITSPPISTERGVLIQTGNGNLVLVGAGG